MAELTSLAAIALVATFVSLASRFDAKANSFRRLADRPEPILAPVRVQAETTLSSPLPSLELQLLIVR